MKLLKETSSRRYYIGKILVLGSIQLPYIFTFKK